jgi:hypothetical protein
MRTSFCKRAQAVRAAFILAAVAATAGPVLAQQAQEAATPVAAEPWGLTLNSGFLSHHTSNRGRPRHGGWNETNGGIGVEWQLSPSWRLAGGLYDNSVRHESRYLQAVFTPALTRWQADGWSVAAGVAAGVVDGYPKRNHGGWAGALLPLLTVDRALPAAWQQATGIRSVGANLTYIPTVTAMRIAGAYALQARVSF